MKLAPKIILLFKDANGLDKAILDALQPDPKSNFQRLEDSFGISLKSYGIEDRKASGHIMHFLNSNGIYEVSILVLDHYEPPVLLCALNEVLASLLKQNSPTLPTVVVPFVVPASKLKMENRDPASVGVPLYGIQLGPTTDLTQALTSKIAQAPPALQMCHEELACLLQLTRVLGLPAFFLLGQSGHNLPHKTFTREPEIIHEMGKHLASLSSLYFDKEKVSWNPDKNSTKTKEPWRALYG